MKLPFGMTMPALPTRGLLLCGVLFATGSTTAAVPAPESSALASLDLRAPGLHRMGGDGARFVLIEFSDYGCAHCAVFHEIVFPKIKREYIDTGRLGYVAMHSPRTGQPGSWLAAEAACAAGAQGKFWEMRELLFANSRNLGRELVNELARRLGMDSRILGDAIQAGSFRENIESEKRCGSSLGVTGTPSFILARVENGFAVDGTLHVGVMRWSTFKARMDALLQSPGGEMQ